MYMPDWNLECEIKIRALEALKENLDKEIDELINIVKKVQQEHLEVIEVQQNLNDIEKGPLTISEFAKKAKVSYGAIYERVRTGVIKAKRDGRITRIPYSEYENYMQRI
jgi:excisionase family DNA binding protein